MEKKLLDERLELALNIAKEASEFLLSHEELGSSIKEKAVNDFVTVADKTVEEIIHSSITKAFPNDGWLGEESGEEGNKNVRWIVDPIDGTVDYMCSFPNYTVSIAFEDEEGLALGVVAVPRQCETFWAVRGGGAWLNGKRIYTNEAQDYSRTLALLVPPHRRHELMPLYMERMVKFYSVFTDMRSIGSAACSICYVACGRCTGYYEMALHLYDYAAAKVILNEAGGAFTAFPRDNGMEDLVASSSSIHETMLEIVK